MKNQSQIKPKIIFLGTPHFAVPSLKQLCSSGNYSIDAVITQPDKPAGRGQKLTPTPVKVAAEQLGLKVFQPTSLKDLTLVEANGQKQISSATNPELAEFLNNQSPFTVFICVAYGKIIPDALLNLPSLGIVNIHPSLLPRWRGAAPIQRALFSGDAETGVSLMKVDQGLDTGPVFSSQKIGIQENDNYGSLHDKLADLGAQLLLEKLPEIISGSLPASPQDNIGATYADKIEEEDLNIIWEQPASSTLQRIRACSPQPGAKSRFKGNVLKIFSAHLHPNQGYADAAPGEIVDVNKEELIVAAGIGEYIALGDVQLPGKKRLSVTEFLRGTRIAAGERFSRE